jgi:hypothetical protein
MKNTCQSIAKQKFVSLLSGKFWLLMFVCLFGASNLIAQEKGVGKLNVWTFKEVASRSKYDEVLPSSYKLRVSKHKNFDRIVFEFAKAEVPEYAVYYTKPPILIGRTYIADINKPTKDEIIKVKGKAFVIIVLSLVWDGKDVRSEFFGEQNLPTLRDIKKIDWWENFFSFAVGLGTKKAFRVQELSNPTRLVIDFKHLK